MTPENLWILFACVSMSAFAYAFLKPMCADCCTYPNKKKKTEPEPEEGEKPSYRTIKISSARAKFRLFPPGESYYVGGPKKQAQEPKKKKKKKLNEKWKACVQNIVISNAIRDLSLAGQTRLTPEHSADSTPHSKIKDPTVFSGLPTLADAHLKLNGGPINNFAKIVEVGRHQRKSPEKEDGERWPSSEPRPPVEGQEATVEVIDETRSSIDSPLEKGEAERRDYKALPPEESSIIHVMSPGQYT